VRLIHGRGIGVQRERVRSLLSKHPLVIEYSDAPPSGGGWGATIATLRESS
jgi:dsDNA-specific endonuclease/ATPase MutS2